MWQWHMIRVQAWWVLLRLLPSHPQHWWRLWRRPNPRQWRRLLLLLCRLRLRQHLRWRLSQHLRWRLSQRLHLQRLLFQMLGHPLHLIPSQQRLPHRLYRQHQCCRKHQHWPLHCQLRPRKHQPPKGSEGQHAGSVELASLTYLDPQFIPDLKKKMFGFYLRGPCKYNGHQPVSPDIAIACSMLGAAWNSIQQRCTTML